MSILRSSARHSSAFRRSSCEKHYWMRGTVTHRATTGYWAALSLSFRRISICIIAWGLQVIQQEAKPQEAKPRGGSATYDKENCFNFSKQTVTIVPNTGPSALFGDEINLYS